MILLALVLSVIDRTSFGNKTQGIKVILIVYAIMVVAFKSLSSVPLVAEVQSVFGVRSVT